MLLLLARSFLLLFWPAGSGCAGQSAHAGRGHGKRRQRSRVSVAGPSTPGKRTAETAVLGCLVRFSCWSASSASPCTRPLMTCSEYSVYHVTLHTKQYAPESFLRQPSRFFHLLTLLHFHGQQRVVLANCCCSAFARASPSFPVNAEPVLHHQTAKTQRSLNAP